MNEKLKPCPFCGSEDITLKGEEISGPNPFAYCRKCHTHGPQRISYQGALIAWNERAEVRAMREIKFRGREHDGYWSYGDIKISEKKEWATIYSRKDGYLISCPVQIETVGQYTGLKDADGREIYEGDILQIQDDVAEMFQLKNPDFVVYESGSFVLNQIYHDWKLLCALVSLTNTKLHSVRVRVIGNIHDNPELLAEVTQ